MPQWRFRGSAHVFDAGDLGAEFGPASVPGTASSLDRHLDAFISADAVIVASPIYKGSYTGLFKHFFDLIDPQALVDQPVLLAATDGGYRHALIIEHQLRPLFGFFEANVLATGVYASSADFHAGRLAAPDVRARLDRAVAQFGPSLLPARAAVA
ncbi:NAD(P)H-dependent oxidoreductase [Paracoccus benzoatiresistens]|uniref:NAD(P)H-dependent oxidoreductase n=1 Tax=Paracoccus benzoatiresistens TaxID=2997341 RepID=UPI002E30F1F8|nr:NAD(P)H-dependent oxidoreductase [Paracoccus sp. EF6]